MPSLFEFAGGEAAFHLEDLEDAGMPADPDFRAAVLEHIDFGTRVAMQNSNAADESELHPLREVPRWRWARDDD